MLPDVVFGCLRQAIPDRVPAEGTSCLWNLTFRGARRGNNDNNYGFAITVTSNGGTGARPMKDGLSATAYPRGVRGTPVEIVEAADTARLLAQGAAPDSGGAGKFRGGLGQIIEVENGEGLAFDLLAAFDSHRSSAARPRRRQQRQGRHARPRLGRQVPRQGLPADPGRRSPHRQHARRRRPRRSRARAADALADDRRDGLVSDDGAKAYAPGAAAE